MKKGFFIVFLLVCVLNVESQGGEIQELEKRIELLETRISVLEKALEGLLLESETESQTFKPHGEPQKNVSVWRKLNKGMSKHEVTSLLGEAKRIDVLSFSEVWYYGVGGILWFDSRGGLDRWSEPMYY